MPHCHPLLEVLANMRATAMEKSVHQELWHAEASLKCPSVSIIVHAFDLTMQANLTRLQPAEQHINAARNFTVLGISSTDSDEMLMISPTHITNSHNGWRKVQHADICH